MVAHPEDAEDIASDVFARAFKGYDRFRSEASPGTWLYRIAVNLCLNHQRRRKYLKWMSFDFWEEEFDELPFESPEKKPDEIMESKDVERLVHRALQELPPAQRAAITLARYENLTSREIAEVMGRSVSSVESLLIRAKKNLARSLQPSLKDL
jgi:RNA polymerase sigma-70 factor (ECF subfamily)